VTRDQLADRLVPGLGLDAAGGMVLDYGPRQFRVELGERLDPVVYDAAGGRLTRLPKPSAKDDAEPAAEAYARFAALRKDVATVAAEQVRRLERAMAAGRRWSLDEHRRLFVEHPLVWHLTRRLVWVVTDADDAVTGSFRLAEDKTFADSSDAGLELPADALVGIAHPVHLAGELVRWTEVFTDYEILQPFRQLTRSTYALDAEELGRPDLSRYDGAVVPTTRVLGLAHRGWERGAPYAGISEQTYRELGNGLRVVVDLDPGRRGRGGGGAGADGHAGVAVPRGVRRPLCGRGVRGPAGPGDAGRQGRRRRRCRKLG
jgi:hypothetical protein